MRRFGWVACAAVVSCTVGLAGSNRAAADVVSDRAAAILIWPDVYSWLSEGSDTLITVSNTSQEAVLLHCFYENANSHCSNTGEACFEASDCCIDSVGCGRCEEGWIETDFRVRLTPLQPLGWLAAEGRADFPLPGGFGGTGPDGSSNAGSRVPPVPEDHFTGALKCIVVNDDGTPSDRNVIKGEQTFITVEGRQLIQVSKSNAIGIEAIEGNVNDDNELILGGPDAEYNGCSNFLIVNHHFDLGENPVTGDEMYTAITLVPCTEDFLRQIPGEAVVQYLVYNEFEQRFSTSRKAKCKFHSYLSEIDTNDPTRSIFSAGVSGTLTGQSRLNPIGSGLIGVAAEYYSPSGAISQFNIHMQGDRPDADIITIP
jgi:hypothetical protein